MATKARTDVVSAQATLAVALIGIPALTPEELTEFIDSPEPAEADVEFAALDE